MKGVNCCWVILLIILIGNNVLAEGLPSSNEAALQTEAPESVLDEDYASPISGDYMTSYGTAFSKPRAQTQPQALARPSGAVAPTASASTPSAMTPSKSASPPPASKENDDEEEDE